MIIYVVSHKHELLSTFDRCVFSMLKKSESPAGVLLIPDVFSNASLVRWLIGIQLRTCISAC